MNKNVFVLMCCAHVCVCVLVCVCVCEWGDGREGGGGGGEGVVVNGVCAPTTFTSAVFFLEMDYYY